MPRVLVPLAQGCEELEAVTIIDLLRRAEIEVVTAGLTDEPVVASRKTVLIPDTTIDAIIDEDFDLIVLPGGLPGADHLRDDPRIIELLRRHQKKGHYTAAICAAPKVLAHAGLLEKHRATAYPGTLESLQLDTVRLSDDPVVVDDKVITSRGPGTAMDFALTLIEQLLSPEKRREVEEPLCRPSH